MREPKNASLSNPRSNKLLDVRGRGKLSVAQSTADLFFKEPFAMLQAVHSLHHTQKTMRDVMLNPGRVDYRDRYIYGLERSHRLSFLRFRETGILLPFADTGVKKNFEYPNRCVPLPVSYTSVHPNDCILAGFYSLRKANGY